MQCTQYKILKRSLPSRERGLKYWNAKWKSTRNKVAPFAGAWIEITDGGNTWKAGFGRSLRGSVDWNLITLSIASFFKVAPFAGAWIEIGVRGNHSDMEHSRSLRGSVDWNTYHVLFALPRFGRSLRGSVDWNCGRRYNCRRISVAPFAGAWIEMMEWQLLAISARSRSLRGSVDWNYSKEQERLITIVAPFAGAWIEIQ